MAPSYWCRLFIVEVIVENSITSIMIKLNCHRYFFSNSIINEWNLLTDQRWEVKHNVQSGKVWRAIQNSFLLVTATSHVTGKLRK